MKRYIFFTLIFTVISLVSFGGTFEIKAIEGGEGYLHIQMRETSGTGTPQTSNSLTDIVFQIKWLTSLGNIDMGSVICTSYEITKSGSRLTQGSYYYQEYYANNTPFVFPENWVQNTWVTIATMEVGTGTGSGTFELGADDFVGTGVNIGVDLTDFTPTVNGSAADYTYPTTVYNYVWTGVGGGPPAQQNQYKWEYTNNWRGTCVGDAAPEGSYPYIGQTNSYVFIPSGVSNYIQTTSGGDDWGWEADILNIESGAEITVPSLTTSTTQPYLNITGNLMVDGTLTLSANGHTTVGGSTTINSATGIIVEADATGVGSFIDNGTITYGGSGTAKVQTYLTNSAGADNFDIHQVGPTVDLISGGTNGALLSAFNLVNGNTYAYEWDETLGFASGWQNIFDNSYVVNTGAGIGLSTDDGSTNTLEMTGALMTGNISSPSLTYSNNHNELISNPYPSAIDFDNLASDNSGVVENKYWIWNPAGNVYVARAAGAGGAQYIQVGQGFFVQTKSGGGTFDFTNSRRVHSNDAFRNTIANILTVKAVGGLVGYEDEMIVRFDEDATSGYDIEVEAEKWSSQNSDATQIWAIAEDNTELAINVLPTASLTSGMTSVPMHFNCGYNTEYSISFFDMETFEIGTEIWLEDKQTGAEWISVNDNPDYTFTATPDDLEDRFVIHFFGPTGVNEFEIENTVEIFSYRQNAFVRNNTNEVIKTVNIYTLSGELIQNNEPANIMLNKFWVSNNVGYYVVRVITDKNVYTNKVFITK